MAAPDFASIELTNIAWKKIRHGTFLLDEANQITPYLRRSGMQLLSSEPLLDAALSLAREFDHPVYDCLYVAAMDLLGTAFLTGTSRSTPSSHGAIAASTYLLSDIASNATSA